MLTAIAVLLLSAIGGGMIGAFLTDAYPNNSICKNCEDKAKYIEEQKYYEAQENYEERPHPDYNIYEANYYDNSEEIPSSDDNGDYQPEN
jgi:hypothetical protein